jgi:hypothetical protein
MAPFPGYPRTLKFPSPLEAVSVRHPGQAPHNGARAGIQDFLEVFSFFWIPDLAMHLIARPE